jgi:hypothetical protein
MQYLASKICISGKLAYLGSGDSGLLIADVTSPSAPRWRGFYDTPDSAWGVSVSGGLAYIADGFSGLRIADVTNPSSPTTRGFYDTPGFSCAVTVSNGLAYIADDTSLQIIDVRNPASPVFRSSYDDAFLESAENVFLSNGIAYILSGGNNLTMEAIDVTNPAAPLFRSRYYVPNRRVMSGGLYVSAGFAYAALDGLRIFDVRNPSAPVLRGFYPPADPLNTGYTGIFVSGDLVYLADQWYGLYILQFTEPLAANHWQLYR